MFHYMFSKTACLWKGCDIAHLGYIGVLIEIREFNIMIRPVKKASQDPPKQSALRRNVPRSQAERKDTLNDNHCSPNNPHHPRHFTTNWRECIYRGCITHEAAKQAERDDRTPPVSHHTHLDHGILN